jgi:hypothetical protein
MVPLCMASIPPVQDYPSHLARAYVLAFGTADPFLSRMYAPDWHVIPNLAGDALMQPLLHLLPLRAAGSVMLGIALVLQVGGVVALHRALHRRRSFWPLASCLVAYNGIFMLGFVNFILGVGAALLVAAAWIALRPAHKVLATVFLAAGATLVFFCHVVALAFLCVIVAGMAVQDVVERRQRGESLKRAMPRLAAELGGGLALPVALYLGSRFGNAEGPVTYGSLKLKLTELLSPVLVYHPWLDGAAALCIVAIVVLSLVWRRRARAPILPLGIALALATLLVAFAVAPFAAKGGAWLDARFPLLAACLLFAGLAPPPMPRAVSVALAVAIAALFVVRTAAVAQVWHGYDKDMTDLERVLSPVRPGDRVLIVRVDNVPRPAWWHQVPLGRRLVGFGVADDYPAVLILTERRAFSQAMFVNPSQQPLRVVPPYDRLMNTLEDSLPDYTLLDTSRLNPEERAKYFYLFDWQRRFDHLLVIDPGGAPDLQAALPPGVEPEGAADIAALFRVRPGAAAGWP